MFSYLNSVSQALPSFRYIPSDNSPLTADQLARVLKSTIADNPGHMHGAKHWMGEMGSIWLKQMLNATEMQQKLFKPFGVPESVFTQWARPMIAATEQAVAEGEAPDLVTRDEQRIEGIYSEQLKHLVYQFTQPLDNKGGRHQPDAHKAHNCDEALDTSKAGEFNRNTCHWACETAEGQGWLLTRLRSLRWLEWQYHSSGQTHLAALKNLLYSLLQVITGETFSEQQQPYRKADKNGNWYDSDGDYLKSCEQRLINLLQKDAFDVRRFALESRYAKIGASEWQTVPGSEMYSIRLRHYSRPEGIKANGKTLYLASPMINRCEIFDLAPGKSVIERMLQLGYDLYMVDYGDPGPDQSEIGLEFYGKAVHDAYIDMILARHPKQSIEVMAYCMGGTLFLPYLARRIEEAHISGREVHIRQVVLMTTPVLFDDEDSGHKWMRDIIRDSYNAMGMKLFYGNSNVSPYAVSAGMHGIQPGVEQSAPEGFYSRANFPGAIEDSAPFLNWLYSGTRFPAHAHQQWIQNIFIDNQIWNGEYKLPSIYPQLDKKPVDMDMLNNADIALFDYCGQRDPIAPVGSCKASERWGRKNSKSQRIVTGGLNRTIEKDIGHIFVVSHKLLDDFIVAVTDFLADEPPAYRKGYDD